MYLINVIKNRSVTMVTKYKRKGCILLITIQEIVTETTLKEKMKKEV